MTVITELMSFEEIYDTYCPELLRYGQRLQINDIHDIEDLVQETFLKYHQMHVRNVRIENPRAWLYKVLLNMMTTRNNTVKARSLRITGFRRKDATTDVHEQYAARERRQLVFQVLRQLPLKEKNLLLLYHNGLKYKEIAEVLDMKPESVGASLARSIDKLRERLRTEYDELFR